MPITPTSTLSKNYQALGIDEIANDIETVFNAVNALESGVSTTKVYKALLTQAGTSAPVATVLENTLGGTIVWDRVSEGSYTATLNGVFTLNKTICNKTASFLGDATTIQYYSSGIGVAGFSQIYSYDINFCELLTKIPDVNGLPTTVADFGTFLGLTPIYIEIEVFA